MVAIASPGPVDSEASTTGVLMSSRTGVLAGSRPLRDIFINTSRSVKIPATRRSEEHTSELQSRGHLVCRLLLEKKKKKHKHKYIMKTKISHINKHKTL